jgi:hypothetical protein
MQMDAVLGKLADTRREFETLSGTVSSVQTMSMSLATEMQRVKLDVRDAHDAIVTHENELRDLTAKLETGVETATRVSQRYESEMVPLLAQRKTATQELQDVRVAAVKDREALETSIKAVREQLGNTDRMVTDTQGALSHGLERQKSVFDGRVKEVQQVLSQSIRDVQTTLKAQMEQQGTALGGETRGLRQEVKTAQSAYETLSTELTREVSTRAETVAKAMTELENLGSAVDAGLKNARMDVEALGRRCEEVAEEVHRVEAIAVGANTRAEGALRDIAQETKVRQESTQLLHSEVKRVYDGLDEKLLKFQTELGSQHHEIMRVETSYKDAVADVRSSLQSYVDTRSEQVVRTGQQHASEAGDRAV